MFNKDRKPTTQTLTVWDMLEHSKTLAEIRKVDSGYVEGWAHVFDKPFTMKGLAQMKTNIARRFYELVMTRQLWYFAYLENVPSEVMLSYPAIERILEDNKIIDLVYQNKLSWDGLVRLAEKGKL